ncbi:MAG: pyridoxal-phosphate dependent enzyme [Phycisphaerales bacterium]
MNHWRYRELLPLDSKAVRNDWSVGWTPVIDVPRLKPVSLASTNCCSETTRPKPHRQLQGPGQLGRRRPRALQHHARTIACASTGNAATSLAGHAVRSPGCPVSSSSRTPRSSRSAQLLVFGANVVAVQGSYDEAYRLCSQACDKFGWYNRNSRDQPRPRRG